MTARLIPTRVPRQPAAAVLVLHGGAARGAARPVSAGQLSVLRMVPVAARIARAGRGRLAVYRLLNSERGWSDARSPVDDVRWALTQLPAGLPVALVGHSLGGRAALLACGAPAVVSAVALAPWVYPDDADDLAAGGRQILIVHGTADRIASAEHSATVAKALSRANQVGYLSVRGGKHAMLARRGAFEGAAASFVVATLLADAAGPPVAQLLAGEFWVEV